MKSFKIQSTLFNKAAVASTVWSTLQQLVVASSTYFILQAIRHSTAGDLPMGIKYLVAFVLSLVLVYIPNTLSMLYLQKWRLASIEQFVQAFVQYNKGKVAQGHSRNKAQSESWLTNESFSVYDEVTNLLYQIYSTLTNAVFNILVIALALDSRILAWYLLASLILVTSNFVFKAQLTKAALNLQSTRKDLSNTMLSAWDNIFIGNKHNFDLWQTRFKSGIQESKKSAAQYDLVRSLISGGTVSIALLVVATGNGIFLWENQSNLSVLVGLMITLPRQIQIIQSIFSFFNLSLAWTGAHQQLKELENILGVGQLPVDSSPYIRLDEIALTTRGQSRWTLRGKNGSGKSTLLSKIKEQLGETAFLLPSRYADLRFQNEFLAESDGNRLLKVFQEIANLKDVQFVLLDEWDANLDGENLAKIDAAIQTLSLDKVVIESRHRA